MVTREQFIRMCRKGAIPFMVLLNSAQEKTLPEHEENNTKRVAKLMKEYSDVFPDELPKELPPWRKINHAIEELPGSKPVGRPYYRMSPLELEELRKQLKDLLVHQIIRESTSSYSAPVLLPRKRMGAYGYV